MGFQKILRAFQEVLRCSRRSQKHSSSFRLSQGALGSSRRSQGRVRGLHGRFSGVPRGFRRSGRVPKGLRVVLRTLSDISGGVWVVLGFWDFRGALGNPRELQGI